MRQGGGQEQMDGGKLAEEKTKLIYLLDSTPFTS